MISICGFVRKIIYENLFGLAVFLREPLVKMYHLYYVFQLAVFKSSSPISFHKRFTSEVIIIDKIIQSIILSL